MRPPPHPADASDSQVSEHTHEEALDPGFPGRRRVMIIGAGHFGKRAVRILSRDSDRRIWMVDPAETEPVQGSSVERILGDGIDFLVEWVPRLEAEVVVVPALPIHLAATWLCRTPIPGMSLQPVAIPDVVPPALPHTWDGGFGTLLVSHVDFLCPDDCPEPEDGCTVTGEIRPPLYGVLRELDVPGFRIHVIQSRQLAPGLGGYTVQDLRDLCDRVQSSGEGKWLIGTACRCHGVVSALAVRPHR